jgi:hypothetical protein
MAIDQIEIISPVDHAKGIHASVIRPSAWERRLSLFPGAVSIARFGTTRYPA